MPKGDIESGARRQVTAVFIDLENFSTIASEAAPHSTISICRMEGVRTRRGGAGRRSRTRMARRASEKADRTVMVTASCR